MDDREPENYQSENLEGEHLTGGPSLKTLLLVLLAVVVVAGGAAAWYLELGVSSEVKRERFVKSARESLSRGRVNEAIIAYRNATDADPHAAEVFHELGTAYLRVGSQREAFRAFQQAIHVNPKLIAPRFQMARLQASKQGLVQADEQLLKIREIDPNAIEAWLLAAEIAVAAKDLDRSVRVLREAIQRFPDKTVLYIDLGTVSMVKQDYPAAEQAYRKALELEPKLYAARMSLASLFLTQGKVERAEGELLNAIRNEPENEELIRSLGNFYSRTRRLDRLEKLYRDLLIKKPGSIAARKVLAELMLNKGDLKQSKIFTDEILKAHSDDSDGRYIRGRLLLAEKEYEKASQVLTTVTVDLPGHAPAYYYLGLARLGSGKVDEAKSALKKATELSTHWILPRLDLAGLYFALGDHRSAFEEIQKVLNVHPNHRAALYTAAGALFKKGDYDKALELFKRIEKNYPQDASVHTSIAGVYMAQYKFAPAQAEYEQAVRMDPNQLNALSIIAQLLVQQGKGKEAVERLQKHLEKARNRGAIYQMLGQISLGAGDTKAGIQYLEKAVAANPKLVDAYVMIGNAYAKLGEFDRAIGQYKLAMVGNPRSVQPKMLLATLYDRKKEYALANEYYEKVLELNGGFTPAANNLAWNITRQDGNLDIALRWAEKARENDQHNPGVADTLGWVLYKRGKFDKALRLLQESNDGFKSKNPQVLYHLGMAYYKKGDRAQARDLLAKALAMGKFEGEDDARKTLSVVGG